MRCAKEKRKSIKFRRKRKKKKNRKKVSSFDGINIHDEYFIIVVGRIRFFSILTFSRSLFVLRFLSFHCAQSSCGKMNNYENNGKLVSTNASTKSVVSFSIDQSKKKCVFCLRKSYTKKIAKLLILNRYSLHRFECFSYFRFRFSKNVFAFAFFASLSDRKLNLFNENIFIQFSCIKMDEHCRLSFLVAMRERKKNAKLKFGFLKKFNEKLKKIEKGERKYKKRSNFFRFSLLSNEKILFFTLSQIIQFLSPSAPSSSSSLYFPICFFIAVN